MYIHTLFLIETITNPVEQCIDSMNSILEEKEVRGIIESLALALAMAMALAPETKGEFSDHKFKQCNRQRSSEKDSTLLSIYCLAYSFYRRLYGDIRLKCALWNPV